MLKEVRLALQQGYEVEVICFEFNNWSYSFNRQIKESLEAATLHIIPAGRKPLLPWEISVFLEKLFRIAGRVVPLSGWWLSQAVSRRSMLIVEKVRQLKGPFDLVIGHNPGALYPVYFAGKKFGCATGFDVEDYHPGEGNEKTASARLEKLMKAHLPGFSYCTFASAPIRSATKELCDSNGIVVMNWFPEKEFTMPVRKPGPLKLIWFSQNISFNRGLERVIPIVEAMDDIELHLIGNCNSDFREQYLRGCRRIVVNEALPQSVLHEQLSEFDCGLAIEPGKDLNNDLAISNKMLACFQAGIFIIASDTQGQKYFLGNHTGHGVIINLNGDVRKQLSDIIKRKEEIRTLAAERFVAAQQYGWEREAEKLVAVWTATTAP